MPDAIPPTYHIIGHAHIDPVWRWTKREGYQEVLATFRSAVDRLSEFPETVFVASSAQFYQWVEKADPSLFAQIQKLVQQNRWNLIGGWWIEADVNLPCGESLVRQGLLGQKYFHRAFGRYAQCGFSPDTFGHPWTLPQILLGQRLSAYFFMRPEKKEKPDLPAPIFNWQGLDGSSILTIQILQGYESTINSFPARFSFYDRFFAEMLPEWQNYAIFYGIGNHGGGPTIAIIEKLLALRQQGYPIKFCGADEYVRAIRHGKFAAVHDELQHHARGCYSAHSEIKKSNRDCETALLNAEKLAAAACMTGVFNYPAADLQSCWQKLLFNQFHDILAGTSIAQACEEARADFGLVQSIAGDIMTEALHHLASQVKTSDGRFSSSQAFIAFNPCCFPVSTNVEIELQRPRSSHPVLRDHAGNLLPFASLPTSAVKIEEERLHYLFLAELPAFGYALYRVDYADFDNAPVVSDSVQVGDAFLQNDQLRVTFDRQTGHISSFYDQVNGRELLSRPAVPVVLTDPDDTWGHNIVSYDQEVGKFASAQIEILEANALRATLRIISYYDQSTIVQDFSLCSGRAELDCRVQLQWRQFYQVLKLSFPTILPQGTCTYSAPYGQIERKMSGEEEPGQTWIDVSGEDSKGKFGLALINDSKSGYSALQGDVRMTVLHSTAYCHHQPAKVFKGDNYPLLDNGSQEFCFRLFAHAGDWRYAQVPQKAEEFINPPQTILSTSHEGKQPPLASLLSLSAPHVLLTAIKKAEDGQAWIIRMVEWSGQASRGELKGILLPEPVVLRFRPYEIKSLKISSQEICEVNLLEEKE